MATFFPIFSGDRGALGIYFWIGACTQRTFSPGPWEGSGHVHMIHFLFVKFAYIFTCFFLKCPPPPIVEASDLTKPASTLELSPSRNTQQELLPPSLVTWFSSTLCGLPVAWELLLTLSFWFLKRQNSCSSTVKRRSRPWWKHCRGNIIKLWQFSLPLQGEA